LAPHTYAIALHAKDEKELQELSFKLFKAGIRHKRIHESDAPWTGQLMAIGIPPQPRSRLKKILSSCKLLK
jgi:peptidyl-tRNA hydrolase